MLTYKATTTPISIGSSHSLFPVRTTSNFNVLVSIMILEAFIGQLEPIIVITSLTRHQAIQGTTPDAVT